MTRIVVKSKVGSDGRIRLDLAVGHADAEREVQITVEPMPPPAVSQEEWRDQILSTAGKWDGDFERPPQGDYEVREPFA